MIAVHERPMDNQESPWELIKNIARVSMTVETLSSILQLFSIIEILLIEDNFSLDQMYSFLYLFIFFFFFLNRLPNLY